MRRLVGVVVLSLFAALPSAAGAASATGKPPSKGQLDAAQKKANAAAARLAKAQSQLAKAQQEVSRLESRASSAKRAVDDLGEQVRQLAVQQYVEGNVAATWVGGDPGQAARGRAMLRFVTLGRTDARDSYEVARADFETSQTALQAQLAKQRAVVADLKKVEASASAQLDQLAAAQKAYEAKLAADRKAAAAKRGVLNVSLSIPVIGGGGWLCPVQGPHAFSNDFGDPRGGGTRTHQGNDILAPRNTPVVASVGGAFKPHSSGLGGISYYLDGDDGNTYYGAHLDHYSGASGHVAAGTVIGYVGNSGDASGGPTHLHFEVHPGGGRAVNPFSILSKFC
ncbi:MAG TPA: peptidoglycan DD-metalloendopeptidase family protein [Acidimicrobiales bacterium]|nr:peptidoglycan DD-metalloendopeptidase family protein [Acidimicrobiales bacterium]